MITKEMKIAIGKNEKLAIQKHEFNESEYNAIKYSNGINLSNSPCIGICKLDHTQHCKGCGRHIDQIK